MSQDVYDSAGRRTAIRQTWMASAPHDVAIKFVLYDKEKTIDILRESSLHQDIIFVPGGNTTDYRSIVFKTFAFVQVGVIVHSGCLGIVTCFSLQVAPFSAAAYSHAA